MVKLDMTALERVRNSLASRLKRMDGGEGSGNWGHEGRPGEVGGSAEGGGVHNRMNEKGGGFTSWSKNRDKLARKHKLSDEESAYVKHTKDAMLIDYTGTRYISNGEGVFTNVHTGEKTHYPATLNCRVLLPQSSNTNFTFTRDEKRAMGIRKGNFGKAYKPATKEEAYNKYVGHVGEVWKGLDDVQKASLHAYTSAGSTYRKINNALRDKSQTKAVQKKAIEAMTTAIDKSEMKEDVLLRRGLGTGGLSKMFGVPEHVLKTHPEIMVGRVGTDHGFGSCGSSPDSGFNRPVQLEILAPKGTKAMYVEPFSACGHGHKGTSWDGESKQSSVSHENETLLQRGTSYQILSCESKDGKLNIKVAVVDQTYNTDKYNKPPKTKKSKEGKAA